MHITERRNDASSSSFAMLCCIVEVAPRGVQHVNIAMHGTRVFNLPRHLQVLTALQILRRGNIYFDGKSRLLFMS